MDIVQKEKLFLALVISLEQICSPFAMQEEMGGNNNNKKNPFAIPQFNLYQSILYHFGGESSRASLHLSSSNRQLQACSKINLYIDNLFGIFEVIKNDSDLEDIQEFISPENLSDQKFWNERWEKNDNSILSSFDSMVPKDKAIKGYEIRRSPYFQALITDFTRYFNNVHPTELEASKIEQEAHDKGYPDFRYPGNYLSEEEEKEPEKIEETGSSIFRNPQLFEN